MLGATRITSHLRAEIGVFPNIIDLKDFTLNCYSYGTTWG
jgi:hypothetical protein